VSFWYELALLNNLLRRGKRPRPDRSRIAPDMLASGRIGEVVPASSISGNR
jgi:hypothetical protein